MKEMSSLTTAHGVECVSYSSHKSEVYHPRSKDIVTVRGESGASPLLLPSSPHPYSYSTLPVSSNVNRNGEMRDHSLREVPITDSIHLHAHVFTSDGKGTVQEKVSSTITTSTTTTSRTSSCSSLLPVTSSVAHEEEGKGNMARTGEGPAIALPPPVSLPTLRKNEEEVHHRMDNRLSLPQQLPPRPAPPPQPQPQQLLLLSSFPRRLSNVPARASHVSDKTAQPFLHLPPPTADERRNPTLFSPTSFLLLFSSFTAYSSWLEYQLLPTMINDQAPETLASLLRLYLPRVTTHPFPLSSESTINEPPPPPSLSPTSSLSLLFSDISVKEGMQSKEESRDSGGTEGEKKRDNRGEKAATLPLSPPLSAFFQQGSVTPPAAPPLSPIKPTPLQRSCMEVHCDISRAKEERSREKALWWAQKNEKEFLSDSIFFSSCVVQSLIRKRVTRREADNVSARHHAHASTTRRTHPSCVSHLTPSFHHGFPVSQLFFIPIWAAQIFSVILKKLQYRSRKHKKRFADPTERCASKKRGNEDRALDGGAHGELCNGELDNVDGKERVRGGKIGSDMSTPPPLMGCTKVIQLWEEVEEEEEVGDDEDSDEECEHSGMKLMKILFSDDAVRIVFAKYPASTQTYLLLVVCTLLAWKMVDCRASVQILHHCCCFGQKDSISPPPHLCSGSNNENGRGRGGGEEEGEASLPTGCHDPPSHHHRSHHHLSYPGGCHVDPENVLPPHGHHPLISVRQKSSFVSLLLPPHHHHQPNRLWNLVGEGSAFTIPSSALPPSLFSHVRTQWDLNNLSLQKWAKFSHFSFLSVSDILHMERFVLSMLNCHIGSPPLFWKVAVELFYLYFVDHCIAQTRDRIREITRRKKTSEWIQKGEGEQHTSSFYSPSSSTSHAAKKGASASTSHDTESCNDSPYGMTELLRMEQERLHEYAVALHNGLESMLGDSLNFLISPAARLSLGEALRRTLRSKGRNAKERIRVHRIRDAATGLMNDTPTPIQPFHPHTLPSSLYNNNNNKNDDGGNDDIHAHQCQPPQTTLCTSPSCYLSYSRDTLLTHPLLGFAFAARHGVPSSWLVSLAHEEEREKFSMAVSQLLYVIQAAWQEGVTGERIL